MNGLPVFLAAVLSIIISACGAAGAKRPEEKVQSWPQKKCAFYAEAWRELLELSGRSGVSEEFIKGNEAFIAAGCSNGADVCPRTRQDGDLANNLTIATMNFGTASTFVPFVCRKAE